MIEAKKNNQKPIVIFGDGDVAQLANYYFTQHAGREVVGFTVDSKYLESSKLCDLPVVPFDDIEKIYPPNEFNMFIALGYSKLNEIRKVKFEKALEKGYELASYVDSSVQLHENNSIGRNCFIFEDNTIQPYVEIGDNVILWSGNHVGHHSKIQCHTFIASHVVISGHVEIGSQCFLGVNSTLRDHIRIGEKTVIGAGAIILSDADANGVYIGNETPRSRVPSSRLMGI